MIRRTALLCLFYGLCSTLALAQPTEGAVQGDEWAAYKARFVEDNGRVVDDGNGGISHSEGQGYGMLLAWFAGNRADFEKIWSFTRINLMLRDDGLFVWRWNPQTQPAVSDPNNASDGDILIAYALALAGTGWNEERYTAQAGEIASTLARGSLFEWEGKLLLRPGTAGFAAEDRPDGPVVNLSYWVFEALPVLEQLAPEGDWAELGRSGLELLGEAAFTDRNLPSDWLSVAAEVQPAEGFPARFSYDAMRIPLYLIRAGEDDRALLDRMRQGMRGDSGGLALVDLATGETYEEPMDAGYRIIQALMTCVIDGTSVPEELQGFEPTLYYPSTLQLLALAHMREERPECL